MAIERFFVEAAGARSLAIRTLDGLGLDVRGVLSRSDLYARPKKYQHAFCTDLDREGDVRIMCSLESDERWMETLLHELGHAVQDDQGYAPMRLRK